MIVGVTLNGACYIHKGPPAIRERKSGHLIYISSLSGTMPGFPGLHIK
jgi:hypothetical protein